MNFSENENTVLRKEKKKKNPGSCLSSKQASEKRFPGLSS